MSYIVIVTPPFGEDDFEPYYKFFATENEAKNYKKHVVKSSDGFAKVEIYEAKQIT